MRHMDMLSHLRLNPHGYEDQRRCIHDHCFHLRSKLPWVKASTAARDAMRAGFAFALTISQSPRCPGSLRERVEIAFGKLPRTTEHDIFEALLCASKSLGHARISIDAHCERALAWAPLFFGGLDWLYSDQKSRAGRLAFCHCLAESLFSRLFFDERAWEKPSLAALE